MDRAPSSGEQMIAAPVFAGMSGSEKSRCLFRGARQGTWRRSEGDSNRWQGQFQGQSGGQSPSRNLRCRLYLGIPSGLSECRTSLRAVEESVGLFAGTSTCSYRPISDREVEDVQSIKQPLTEFATRNAIGKRHGRVRNEANCGRSSSCRFKVLKHVQQTRLDQGLQLLNVAEQQRPARRRGERKATPVPESICCAR